MTHDEARPPSPHATVAPAGRRADRSPVRQPLPSHPHPEGPATRSQRAARHLPLLGSVALLAVAALALTVPAAGQGVLSADLSVARRIQAVDGPLIDALVAAGELLGSTLVLLGFASVILLLSLLQRRWADAALVLAAVVSQFLGLLLKAAADSPRPTPDLIRVTAESEGAGFPSRTTMAALLAYGTILYLAVQSRAAARPAIRWPLIVAFAFAVLLVGFERVAVGAHWSTDVLGGYLWGGAVLLLLIAAHRLIRARE